MSGEQFFQSFFLDVITLLELLPFLEKLMMSAFTDLMSEFIETYVRRSLWTYS